MTSYSNSHISLIKSLMINKFRIIIYFKYLTFVEVITIISIIRFYIHYSKDLKCTLKHSYLIITNI